MAHTVLDVRHQLCPIPVIRSQNTINKLKNGDFLDVLCTDPGAMHDIPTWCRIHGHKVVDASHKGNEIKITIEVVDTK